MFATETLAGGFANPVFEAQSIFRAVMDGTANPGTMHSAQTMAAAPEPFGKAAASILLTLCDFETGVWISPSLSSPTMRGWINFHAGAPLLDEPARCAFAFVNKAYELPQLTSFASGNDEYPDTSTTIVLEIEALDGGVSLVIEGPGINGFRTIAPVGLPVNFTDMWAENATLFPCGVDLILTAGDTFLCLPRTTRIREA